MFDSAKTWGYKVIGTAKEYCIDCEENRVKQLAFDENNKRVKVCTICNKTYFSEFETPEQEKERVLTETNLMTYGDNDE